MLPVVIPKHLGVYQSIQKALLVAVWITGPLAFIQDDMEGDSPFIVFASFRDTPGIVGYHLKMVVFSMWRWTEIDVTLGLELTASSNKEGP
jgi:hypothetical protein